MFNDKYGLTDAVVRGDKTQTRRIVKIPDNYIFLGWYNDDVKDGEFYKTVVFRENKELSHKHIKLPYKIGETVAVAQSYKEAGIKPDLSVPIGDWCGFAGDTAAWNNKMFVNAYFMPYQIEITNVRVERLQDISDEDCLKEGVASFAKIYADKEAIKYGSKIDYQHWIVDEIEGSDQSFSYCRKCAEKVVERLRKKHDFDTENDIYIDGGWTQEQQSSVYCEKCDKPLEYSFIGKINNEMENIEFDNPAGMYLLDQVLWDEETTKILLDYPFLIKKAFAKLIDKVNGKGTWESNQYVFVYDFKLTKNKR